MAAPACLIVRNAPVRLVSITRLHSSNGNDVTGPTLPVPADATAMSSPPVASQRHRHRGGDRRLVASRPTPPTARTRPSGATRSQLVRGGPQRVLAASGDRDRRAVARGGSRAPEPDAGPTARDERRSTGERRSLAMTTSARAMSPQSGATPSPYADPPWPTRTPTSCPDR